MTVLSIDMPTDFPTAAYDAVGEKLGYWVAGLGAGNSAHAVWAEYAAGWNAVGYRFRTAADADTTFTASIARAPIHEEYRIQEEALFVFFVSGYAAIESFSYTLFALGALLNPAEFPLSTARDRRNIKPELTANKFQDQFLGTPIQKALSDLLVDPEFNDWGVIRNVLAHRVAPRRHSAIHLTDNVATGTASTPWTTTWEVSPNLRLPLDNRTTADKRAWLAEHLTKCVQATELFATDKFRLERPLFPVPPPGVRPVITDAFVIPVGKRKE